MKTDMEPRISTLELVTRAQKGDREAFAALLDRYRNRLQRIVQREMGKHLRQETDPEDVVQETCLRAFNAIPRFSYHNEESFPRWLAAIANHIVLELAGRHERSRTFYVKPDIEGDQVSPSRIARRGERFDRLVEALHHLSADHREVIVLSRIEGLRMKEVAKRMNRSENAVLLLLSRALKKLKEHFGETESLHLPWRSLKDRGSKDAQ